MKMNKSFFYLLLLLYDSIFAIGSIISDDSRRILFSLGLMGVSIILEKDLREKIGQKNILKRKVLSKLNKIICLFLRNM